jgi:phosphohistidine phosphatase
MNEPDSTLILLRHSKAEHAFDVADADRPLTERGHRDATAAGGWLVEHDLVPDLVLCSPARRTRQTWHEVALAFGERGNGVTSVYEPGLYGGFDLEECLELIHSTEADVRVLMLVGHNPTMGELSRLLGGGEGADLRTSGIAVHRAPGSWASFAPGAAPLTASHTARG